MEELRVAGGPASLRGLFDGLGVEEEQPIV
jgi:hypothetical protein